MKRLFRTLATLALAWAGLLACHAAFGQNPAPPPDFQKLVKSYAFENQPKLNPETQFAIEEYSIDGLKALNVQIILARYLGADGGQFNEALLLYHNGKLSPLAITVGGQGLMSAVVSGGKLYYTYSFGSGRHRSHLAQLSIAGGKPTFAESGPLLDQDCFVKQDGARLRLEKGKFEKLNVWKAGRKIGEVAEREKGFAVLDDAGKEIEKLRGNPIEEELEKIQ